MNKKKIAIDMDGVMADVETQFIEWYAKDTGKVISKESLIGKPEREAFPETGKVKNYAATKGFFATLKVMDDAQEVIAFLMEHYEVYIVSAAMEFPQSLIEKYHWLAEFFPAISWQNIVLCGKKDIINADYLIDDHIRNLDPFTGKTLLFTAFHNVNYTHHERVNNWKEVQKFFEKEMAV